MNTPQPYDPVRTATLGQAGLKAKTEQGFHRGPIPLGYKAGWSKSAGGFIEPDPTTAPFIQEIYRLKEKGVSIRAIRAEITQRGLRTRRGGVLSVSAIQYILTCPTYRGFVQLEHGKLVLGMHRPLIHSAEQHQAASDFSD